MIAAPPHRAEFAGEIVPRELVEQQHLLAFAVLGAADEQDLALSGLDARKTDSHRVDAGALFAHEGAGGAGDAVHDRDVAGEQVRELRQKQCRPQVAHQPLVEERLLCGDLAQAGEDRAVGGKIALAAAGGDDQVHAAEQFGVALGAGTVEREAGGIGADPLPRLHLPLVAFLRNLQIEIHRRQRMGDVGRVRCGLDVDLAGLERLPMGVRALPEGGHDADPGDPGLPRRINHAPAPPPGARCAEPPRSCWCGISGPERP